MFKSITVIIALFYLAAVNAGAIETHHVVHEPVLTKVGSVVHSAPSAVSHQSFTRVHNKAVVSPVLAPVVKTTVHAAPIVKTIEPVVHAYAAAPAVHTSYISAPALHTSYVASPAVHTTNYAAAPLVHSAPIVQSSHVVHSAPAAYTIHH